VSIDRALIQVPQETARIRLDRFLADQFPQESRSQIQGWIREGSVLVDGRQIKSGHLLRPGEVIEIKPREVPTGLDPQPEDIPLHFVYEDSDLAVVDKPAGMVCHAGPGQTSGTMVNALLHHLGPLETGDARRPGIVHRLDKLTSGLLVVAKTPEAHRGLANQFKSRKVHKEYLALVYGRPVPVAGTIDLPLGRDPRDRKKISTHARHNREAITHYQEVRAVGPFCLLRVHIETGRTHQIRVHLAQIGHPVVGDALYGSHRVRGLPNPIWKDAVRDLQRQFLHSHSLEFNHPRTGDRLEFTSPLPRELAAFLELIEAPAG
jgi:23S rRNA pseudouridine1911/1915/1917 synthase